MVPRKRISALAIDTPLNEVVGIVAQSPYSRLPIYRGTIDNIVGILRTKDLVRWFVEGRPGATLAELMRPIPSVHESVTADRILKDLRERRSHQALVVDESGGTAGLAHAGRRADRTARPRRRRIPDQVSTPLKRSLTAESASQVRWVLTMRRLLLETRWETDASTVGGLVTEALGHIPAEHETVVIGDFEFEVERVTGSHPTVGRRQARGPGCRRRTRGDGDPRSRSRSSSFSSWPTACSWPPSSPSSAPRDPASSIRRLRAAGWLSACCASSRIRLARIATSRRLRSASPSRASGWGCTASTGLPNRYSRGSSRLETLGWIAAHTVASVVAVAVLTYLHIVIGEMVPKALALQRADKTVLYVSPLIRGLQHVILPLVVVAQRRGQSPAAPGRHRAARGRARALSHRRGARSSSSARARKAACCAASPGRSCATCSSSAIGPRVR